MGGPPGATKLYDLYRLPMPKLFAYAESAEKGRSILDHRPDLGADYLALAEEVLGRIGLEAERKRVAPLLSEFRVA